MDMYEGELAEALGKIDARGLSREDFAFAMDYLPPDPDGAGMFTVAYEIAIRNLKTDKAIKLLGGIGYHWVARFDEALADGDFA